MPGYSFQTMSSSPSNPDALEKFLEKILEQRDGEAPELDSESLRALAVKYGLDDDAYEKLVQEAG